MNAYELKQEERRQRLLDKAERTRKEAAQMLASARTMGSVIPFGQPILVGHYSERGDRNFRARMVRKYEKGFELNRYADTIEQRAASVGTGGISADDPDAIVKLKTQLAELEAEQALMVAANKIIRKFFAKRDLTDSEKLLADMRATLPQLTALGLSESTATQLFKADFAGRRGYPAYKLTNNNGNMKRIRERIASLEERAQVREQMEAESPTGEAVISETVNGLTIERNVSENRVLLFFPGKPSEAIRTVCKQHGFRWSPMRGAWSRQLTGNAIWAADCVKTAWLKEQEAVNAQ